MNKLFISLALLLVLLSTATSNAQTKSAQVITFDALSDKVYGDPTFTLNATASSGLAVTFKSSKTSVATVSGNTVTIKGVGTTNITASQAGNTLFNAATAVVRTLTVTKKSLTITSAAVTTKIYNGTTAAVITGTLTGIVGTDAVTLTGKGTFANKDAANNIDVVSTSTLGGTKAAKYTLVQPTGLTGNITPKTVTLTSAKGVNKIYNGNTDATITGNISGKVTGDVVTLVGTGTFASANVGTAVLISANCSLTGANASNYALTQPVNMKANITKKALTIASAAATTKVYDMTKTATITGILTGVIGTDDVVLNPAGTFSTANVGTNIAVTSTSTITGASAANYSLTKPTGITGIITKRPLTITGLTVVSKQYDGTTSATFSGGTLVGVIAGDAVTLVNGGAFTTASVGNSKEVLTSYTLSGTSAANYDITQPTEITGVISPKSLSITNPIANDKTYDGTTNANISGTLTGILNSEIVSFNGLGEFASANAGNAITVTATSTLLGVDAANYTLTQPTGLTANILKATPVITWSQDFSNLKNTDAPLTLLATSNVAELSTITYTSSNTNVAAISGSTMTLVGVGTATVTASLFGNSNYNSAISVLNEVIVQNNLPDTLNLPTATNTLISAITVNSNSVLKIPAGGTLTIDATKTVNDINIAPGGNINFTNGSINVLGNVTLTANETSSFSLNLGSYGMNVTGNVNYVKTMNNTHWYFVSFPCNIPVNNITKAGGSSLGTLGVDWFVRRYDGALRAQNLGATSNWIKVLAGETLQAYQGYIIGIANGKGPFDVSFPLSKTLVVSETEKSVAVTAHGSALPIAENHKGWNLVGLPYLSKYNCNDVTNSNLLMVINDGTTYNTFAKSEISSMDPFVAYFVQANSELTSIDFGLSGRRTVKSAVKNNISDNVKLILTTPTGTDKTNIIISPDQSNDYQIGNDMEKWLTTGTAKPQLYTTLNGVKYSYNAIPMVNNLSLDMYSLSAGNSTISVDASNAEGITQLLLKDNTTGEITDLMLSNYSFVMPQGTVSNRFSVTAYRSDNSVVTQAPNNEMSDNISITMMDNKILVNNLTVNTSVKVYNSGGKLLTTLISNSNYMEIPVLNTGIHIVKIQNGDKVITKKIVAQI